MRQAGDVMREFGVESLSSTQVSRATRLLDDELAARRAVFCAATWQRCQFHLARNAVQQAPNRGLKNRVGKQFGAVWSASCL